jgi:hypothetical protein
MKAVSGWFINIAAVAVVVTTLVAAPAFAATKTPDKGGFFESLVRKIVRSLDEIDVRLPPG